MFLSDLMIILKRYIIYIISAVAAFFSFNLPSIIHVHDGDWYLFEIPVSNTLEVLASLFAFSGALRKMLEDRKFRKLSDMHKRKTDINRLSTIDKRKTNKK